MTNQSKMDLWLSVLEINKLPQTQKRIGDENTGMCCLGVLDYVAFDSHSINKLGAAAGVPVRDEMLAMGLEILLTETEKFALRALWWANKEFLAKPIDFDSRSGALTFMNDDLGFSFPQIANMIKFFGWDVLA